MAEARCRDEWNRTSSLLAMLANANRDPKKTRAFRPRDFNPFERRRERGLPITRGNISALKALLPRRR